MGLINSDFTYSINTIGFDNLADLGIIIESYRILDVILELNHDYQRISSYHLDYDWFLFKYKNIRVTFAVSQGAAMAVDLAERFRVSGVKYVVRIGTIGALATNLNLGEFIIPYASIKDEGTSDFYIEEKSPALSDVEFTQAISNHLRNYGHNVHNGIVWSTDGRWKESDDSIRRRVMDGAIGTDMESSALFAFGINRRVRVASVSVLSDEISDSGDEYKGLSDKDVWFKKVLPMMSVAFESIVSVTNGLIEKEEGTPLDYLK